GAQVGRVGEALSISRRSTPALVSLTNAVFGHAFTPTLQRAQVVLSPSRHDIPGQPALLNWSFESRKNQTDYRGLGPAVHQLLGRGLQVFDKGVGTLRPLRPGDIGVMFRDNKQVPLAVAALQAWGVPAASPRAGLLGTAEALLVLACLRRLHNARDTVATALVLTLADCTPVQHWLADRLNHLSQLPAAGASQHGWHVDGATPHPLLGRLEHLRPRLAALTPSEALQLAVAESQVAQRVHRWAATAHEAQTRLANVEALAALGTAYEDECAAARRPATVGGLLAWLAQRAEDGTDERAAAAGDAVSVLTYHRAKGLEWPVAVLTALDTTVRSALWSVRARTQGDFDAAQPLTIGRAFEIEEGNLRLPGRNKARERSLAALPRTFDRHRRMDRVGRTDPGQGLRAFDHGPRTIIENPEFNSGFSMYYLYPGLDRWLITAYDLFDPSSHAPRRTAARGQASARCIGGPPSGRSAAGRREAHWPGPLRHRPLEVPQRSSRTEAYQRCQRLHPALA
ncbi:MAG: hypothetical protein RL479_952, partial [Verrucomicrobiota bacterium]